MTKSLIPLITIITFLILLLIKISIKRNNLTSLIITIWGFILTIISIFYTKNNNFSINYLFLNDMYSNFYIIILICNNIITCLISYKWLSNLKYNKDEFYLLTIISTMGSIVLLNSNNFISMLVGIELISIPIFGLISYNINLKYSLEASIKYVILSTIASSFIILGISFIYLDNGNLNFTFLINHYLFYNKFLVNYLTTIGFCLILVSLSFKLSIVPFHLWTSDVYQGAPTSVTIFLTTFNKLSIFIFLVKFLIYFTQINNNEYFLYKILIILSILSIIFGNIMGVKTKNNIKRLLAYSSIAHIGYMLIILIYNQKNTIHILSLEMMVIYIIGYIVNNLVILGIISLFESFNFQEKNIDKLYYYRGLFWYDPMLAFIFTIMLFSLAGIPLTIGFISKFYLILLSIKMKIWYLTIIIILGSSVGLYYYLRIIISLYLIPSKVNRDWYISKIKNNNFYFFIKNLFLLLTIIIIILGIYPEFIIHYIKNLI
ncbi:NADH-quinone oxidoreductase subunit NuoN [Enterobacteriaceae endosymbiont of Donacia marginata]|uniref:NADH-quinone oxidoreductase subunit N n=1 Tax=Enterobacteriaceae endosymbiont of Donacia marginata TaxID=2675779 RepID=UPI001448ADEB|nr:NADH-quinone oxidoreductase subunit N [Enterobacteriaceae endosymbiont of Donacia marginata]QJC38269.1 NADH-quinone oxidoreductase subunit NuoN [Enterobacteriaceae endosymbiont of Donacia marginata]